MPPVVPSMDGADVDGNAAGSDSETFGDNPGDGSYDPDELNEEEEDQGDDISGSEDDIDEELDEAVARVIPTAIPTVKIPPKVNIKFEVPYKNRTRNLTGITSRTEFDDFLVAVAGRMKTCVGALNIGYIPWYNKARTPKLLEDDESWDSLVGDVQQYIKSCQSKNRGKGTVPLFSILIVDMDKLQEAKAKGKGSKGAKSKKDDSDDEIEKQHHCSEYKAACFVLNNGEHHGSLHMELATWALLASRHQATIDEPPKQLGLEVSHARQKKAKNHQADTAAYSNDSTPRWVQALAPVLGALLNNRPPTAPPEWQQYPMIPPVVNDPRVHVPHSMQPGVKRPAEDAPAPEMCPDIATWLMSLDSDPIRGRMNLNFSQYREFFLENGFFKLSDLANVSTDQLRVLPALGGVLMSFGIANRLITYPTEDLTPVSNKRPRVD
ncbi:hypothetical protein B0H16DRAFT_1735746 [Mycena metata]|uniref:SAM domain-containing protein n=1 Tax=Mycena metata TaxID=1033252 RepID=A0AAD7MNY4_9AGAR|nr:hypothetical protein B0H16DRAFT_1735746 [Mycena metata]